MLSKYSARSVKREISRVLWDVWDPIGVKQLGGPRDEYEDYVNDVYELLASGASDEAIARHLHHIVTDTMGMDSAEVRHMFPTVAALREIRLPTSSHNE